MKVQSRVSDLKFRHVGNRVLSKLSYRSQGHQINQLQGKLSHFKDEQPQPFNFSEKRDDCESENNLYKYSAIEDTRVSRFTHHQILLVQKNILVLTLLVIFFGMIKIEADVADPSDHISIMVMRIMTCCILIIILLVTLRKILILQLEIDQRNVYIRRQDRKNCRSSLCMLFRDRSLLLQLILEVIMIIPHPAAIFHGITYTQYDQNQQALFVYSVNDLLSVLMMTKIYLVFRSLVALTSYSSPRAIRLCNYNLVEHGFFFSIKCLQHEYPLACTSVVFAFTSVIFSFGFRVTEGNFYYLNSSVIGQKRGFQSYGNCIWYTFTTMTSIGYGQYIPITPIGRFLASIMSIFGVILNSFLVVALTYYLKMRAAENRSHTTLQRLHEQQRLYDESAGVLSETIQVTQLLSTHKLDPLIMKRMKPVFEDLKKKIDKTKANTRLIKAILPQQNKTELMIHEFQLVKDYFKQFYNKQRKLKQKIQKIESLKGNNLDDVRRSFMNEMQFVVERPSH